MEDKTTKPNFIELLKKRKTIIIVIIVISFLFPIILNIITNGLFSFSELLLGSLVCVGTPLLILYTYNFMSAWIFPKKNASLKEDFFLYVSIWVIFMAYIIYVLITGDRIFK